MNKVKKANWFFFAVVCVYLGGSLLFGLLSRKVELPYNLLVMTGQILIGGTLIVHSVITKGSLFKQIRHERLGIIDILLVALIMFLCLPLVYFINYVSMMFTENEIAGTMSDMVSNPYIVNLAMIALTPAIVEELVCRGVLYHSYKTKNTIFAIVMSAFIFGLLHMNLNQMLYAMALGIVFCLVVEATGSIYSSMIMHFIMNSISTTMLALLKLLMKSGLYSEEMLDAELVAGMQNAATLETPPVLTVILIVIGILIVVAFGACAVLLMGYLAKRRGHYEEFRAIFKKDKNKTTVTLEDIAADKERKGTVAVIKEYGVLVITIIICILAMIFL